MLVECDGARGRLLKAPAAHEPVVPPGASVLVVVASLDCLGRALADTVVHRAGRLAGSLGLPPGSCIDVHVLAAALQAYVDRRPPGARLLAFLNAAEADASRGAAVAVASALVPGYDAAFLGSARDGVAQRAPVVHALVLAAGASSRLGRPKMLLDLIGRPLVRHAVDPLLEAGLSRVRVVLGADADAVAAVLPVDRRVAVSVNPDWASGLASSLRAGLDACAGADAILVVLGDQPTLSAGAVVRVLAAAPGRRLVAAQHAGRLVHPMLFGRELFPELEALRGDVGAREVVRRHRTEAALVAGDAPRDVDTEQDYLAAREGRPPGGGEGLV